MTISFIKLLPSAATVVAFVPATKTNRTQFIQNVLIVRVKEPIVQRVTDMYAVTAGTENTNDDINFISLIECSRE